MERSALLLLTRKNQTGSALNQESWLGSYDYPGSHPRILEDPKYICEGNMAVTAKDLKKPEDFWEWIILGIPHIASHEIIFLIEQIKKKDGKVAFIPNAVAVHNTNLPTRRWMIMRAFWNGVSKGMLEYLLHPRAWLITYSEYSFQSRRVICVSYLDTFFFGCIQPG